ncbi:MAG TPA: hypothetical protein VIH61_07120, partial [Waddliaceae bacterium]
INQRESKKIYGEPLPFLLNLQISSDSPLMKEMPKLAFLRNPQNGATLTSNLELDDILDISLAHWINENEQFGHEKKKINDLKNLPRKNLIDERINAFDSEVQLRERLKRLQYFCNLKVGDLLAPWKDSPLKYALMMDDELDQLKFLDINALSPKFVLQTFSYRVSKISKANTAPLSIDNVEDLLLVDAPKLTAEKINKHSKSLLPSVFCLISSAEVPKIDVTRLVKYQLHALFTSEEHVHYLKKERLEFCIPLIEEKELLRYLSEDQVIALNFEKAKVDQAAFDEILQGYTTKTEKILHTFQIEKISKLHQFFSDAHWNKLKEEQVLKIIRAENFPISQKLFNSILTEGTTRTKNCLQQLSADEINKLHQFFSDLHWKELKEEQVLEIIRAENFPISEELFNSILTEGKTRTEKCLQQLSADEINKLHEFFSDAHWKELKGEQVLEIIRAENFPISEKLFNSILTEGKTRTEKCLQQLSADEINKLHQFFSDAHWKELKGEQVIKLSSLKEFQFSKSIFDLLYPKFHPDTRERIQKLSLVDIYRVVPFFEDQHWELLSVAAQVANFDFQQVDVGQKVFDTLFPKFHPETPKKIEVLSVGQVKSLKNYFSDDRVKLLSKEQLTVLN